MQTVKTFLISSGGQDGTFDIIGQMEWFDLINETPAGVSDCAALLCVKPHLQNHREEFAGAIFKTGLCASVLYTLFSVGVLIYGSVLIGAMSPGEIDIAVTSTYLRLETLAFMMGIIVSFANAVFVVIGKAKNVYIFLAVRMALSLVSDLLLIPSFGVYGVAVSNIISNTLLSAACILLLYKQGYIRFCCFKNRRRNAPRMVQNRGVFGTSAVYRQPYLCRYGLQNGEYGRRAGQLLDSK